MFRMNGCPETGENLKEEKIPVEKAGISFIQIILGARKKTITITGYDIDFNFKKFEKKFRL